jgi:hypothetical protein
MYNDSSCSVGVVQLSGRDFYEAVDSEVGANNAESVDSHENSSITPSGIETSRVKFRYSMNRMVETGRKPSTGLKHLTAQFSDEEIIKSRRFVVCRLKIATCLQSAE